MAEPGQTSAKDWFERGYHYKRSGEYDKALDAFRESIRLNPSVAAPWIGLAQLLDGNSQFEDSRQCLLYATRAEPGNVMAHRHLASACQRLGDIEDARSAYQRALELDPNDGMAYLGLGQLLEDIGQPEDAAKAYRQAIKFEPRDKQALANLLGLGKQVDISAEIAEATTLLPTLDATDRALVGYGLGKAHEQKKEFDAAFTAFNIANAARSGASEAFHKDGFDARIDVMVDLFSNAFFQKRRDWGVVTERPVFIVGLPRSGTTLIEQILASHPDCFGAGELAVLTDLATGTPDRLGDESTYWPFCAPRLSKSHITDIAGEYLASSTRRATDAAKRVIDKQPLNFWHLGLIAIALPKARIIHCTRDIRDCGLSIYTHNFSVQQNWSTDLNNIAHYWQGYRKLMAHWQIVSGLQILDISYEDTVSDLEQQARRLLDFLSLPWDERVLAFHTSERAVQTPSRWQVRQPLYTSSTARWRKYEPYLAPLVDVASKSKPHV
ncbi:MAG: sulfotransferase [Pseudomonadota bacterium]